MTATAYRNAELYRHEGKYQFGVFPLGYRNSYAYQSKVAYRLGVDDPIFDTFSVADSATLTVDVTPTDTFSVAESTPNIHVQSLAAQGTRDSQLFLEATVGTVGLNQVEAISGAETLNTQGTSVNSTDSITGAEGTAGLHFELQTDSGSGAENWVSTTVTMTLTDAATALEALGAVAISSTDTFSYSYGNSMQYRTNFDYQNVRDYRYRFGLMSITYKNDYPYRMEGSYGEGLMSGVMVDVVPVDAENFSALEFLDYSGGGNNRLTTQSEEIIVEFNLTGPFGEVAQHLSHIAVNRYRSTPSSVRRR